MQHDGNVLKSILQELGVKYSHLAKLMGVHRNTITNLINTHNLSSEKLLEVGQVLKYDMSRNFSKLKVYGDDSFENSKEIEYRKDYNLEDCKYDLFQLQKKYIALLESHNRLLESQVKKGDNPSKTG